MIIWKNEQAFPGENRQAVFLDRDGVINIEKGYIASAEDLYIYDYIEHAVRMIHEKGYYAIVVSNQSGVARGIIQEEELLLINEIIGNRTNVDAVYCCPHYEKGIIKKYASACTCRKPHIGLIQQAVEDYQIDLSKSYIVGDRAGDILTGQNAGIKTVLVNTGYGVTRLEVPVKPDYVFEDIRDFVKIL